MGLSVLVLVAFCLGVHISFASLLFFSRLFSSSTPCTLPHGNFCKLSAYSKLSKSKIHTHTTESVNTVSMLLFSYPYINPRTIDWLIQTHMCGCASTHTCTHIHTLTQFKTIPLILTPPPSNTEKHPKKQDGWGVPVLRHECGMKITWLQWPNTTEIQVLSIWHCGKHKPYPDSPWCLRQSCGSVGRCRRGPGGSWPSAAGSVQATGGWGLQWSPHPSADWPTPDDVPGWCRSANRSGKGQIIGV